MMTVSFCFPRHVSQQREVRSIRSAVGSPVTMAVAFPHHAVERREVYSIRGHVGSPVTVVNAFPHHASRQTERHSIRAHVGNPVTTQIVFPHHVSRQTEWRTVRTQVGSSVTETVAFPHHVPLQAELRTFHAHIGSPVSAAIAFPPYFPQRAELRLLRSHVGNPVTVTVAFPTFPKQTTTLRWASKQKVYTTAAISFRNVCRNNAAASIKYRYDWKTTCTVAIPYCHRSLVTPGWRIVAKNLETGEVLDLGLIEPENPVLEDVFLPDGDYEISVLTSSLFWKDCLDRTVRMISVRPGEEVTPLPTIYNLRSAVLDGVTTIRWSANRSDLGDCGFGVWYDAQSPVDTNRPPDVTVWYYSLQTEYATTFYQNAPAYVAVAAMRSASDEIGKVHELFLDWSSVPPRRPDDVIVFSAPLPVIDPAIEQRRGDDPFWTMWDG